MQKNHNQEYQISYQMARNKSRKEMAMRTGNNTANNNVNFGIETEAYILDIDSENGRVGILLSSKALVQLLLNPMVGIITAKVGYHLPLFFGTSTLLLSAICK